MGNLVTNALCAFCACSTMKTFGYPKLYYVALCRSARISSQGNFDGLSCTLLQRALPRTELMSWIVQASGDGSVSECRSRLAVPMLTLSYQVYLVCFACTADVQPAHEDHNDAADTQTTPKASSPLAAQLNGRHWRNLQLLDTILSSCYMCRR